MGYLKNSSAALFIAMERRPAHELHRNEQRRLEISDLVDGYDVGVVKGRGGFGFLLETLPPQSIGGYVRAKDLDGGIATESGVFRTVELPHPAGADRRDDLIIT